MEIYLIIIIALSVVSIMLAFVSIAMVIKSARSNRGASINEIRDQIRFLENSVQRYIEDSNTRQAQRISTDFANTNRLALDNMSRFTSQIEKGNQETVVAIKENLDRINRSVNEQLTENLQKRLDSSYSKVSESLERIHKWLGEMQELSTGVSDLKKVLSGVKTRGNWGETSLEAILEQILTVDQYKKQVAIKGQSIVDFAIILPGKGDNENVYLPIDAKFPVEDYYRMCEAGEKGDSIEVDRARKALVARVKQEAHSIKEKYIKVPKTTDFAIMYVPTEGLFAELLRCAGLSEELQNSKIVLAGPTTITALLNSLRMGFKTLAIEKRSTEITKLLASFNKEFEMYTRYLLKTKTQIDSARDNLENVVKRSEKIQAKLQKVEVLPEDESDNLLSMPDSADYYEM